MNLKTLSDSALLANTRQLARQERQLTLQILNHLQEIEKRRLHNKEGYPSLFAYCTEVLGYSETAALRRIDAARLLNSVPTLAQKIEEGELKLSQLAQVQSVVKAEKRAGRVLRGSEKKRLIESVAGKSSRETERTLLSLSPAFQASRSTQERVRAVSDTLSELNIPADQELLELITEAKALMACPQDLNPSMAKIVKEGLRLLLAQKKKQKQGVNEKSPPTVGRGAEARHEPSLPTVHQHGRGARCGAEARHEPSLPTVHQHGRGARCGAEARHEPSVPEIAAPTSRYIPVALKKAIHLRAQNRCEYKSASGQRCKSHHALELHHLQNFSQGGAHSLQNLALYCRSHNAAKAQSDFGFASYRQR
jgi:hypothetical protein